MRRSAWLLCFALLSGCAADRGVPVASVARRASAPAPASSGIEVRHMYLFKPGKAPVKIVLRDDGSSIRDEAWNDSALAH